MKKKNQEVQEKYNEVIIGNISLSSSELSIDELISRAVCLIKDKLVREYLIVLKATTTGDCNYAG